MKKGFQFLILKWTFTQTNKKTKKGKYLKKIILSSLLASTLLLASELEVVQDKTEISTQISQLKARLASLELQLKTCEVATPHKEEIKTHTELGYIGTTGNTNTKTFNLESKLTRKWDKHEAALLFDGQYANDQGVESKNKYFMELNYDYSFTDRFSFNYLLGYKSDKFSAFDYQAYTGPGAKYKAIVSPTHNLSVEGNILYAADENSQIKYSDAGKTTVINYPNAANAPVLATDPSFSEEYAAFRTKAVYAWRMFENLNFNQELSYRGSLENSNKYFVYSKTGFTSKLSDIFSAGISYKVDYVNEPGDKKNQDTTLTANLVIEY